MAVLKTLGIIVSGIILAIPISFFVAIASLPLLRDAEKRWDIEVIGHSGPADWVLWTIWIVISAMIAATIWLLMRKRGDPA
ncbi:MAG: hypothetical protein OER56_06100 [Hyphomicrobiales bacterium]|nr:hypothetical protein [Hyphomicrobiales bacterium]